MGSGPDILLGESDRGLDLLPCYRMHLAFEFGSELYVALCMFSVRG